MSGQRSSADPQKREETFRQLICDLSEHIKAGDATMIMYLKNIPDSEPSKTGLELLRDLHVKGQYTATRAQPLVDLMKSIKRIDLAERVEEYQSVYPDVVGRHRPLTHHSESVPSPRPHRTFETRRRSNTIPNIIITEEGAALAPEGSQTVIGSSEDPLSPPPHVEPGYPWQESGWPAHSPNIQTQSPHLHCQTSSPIPVPRVGSSPQIIRRNRSMTSSLEAEQQDFEVSGSSGPPSSVSSTYHIHLHLSTARSPTHGNEMPAHRDHYRHSPYHRKQPLKSSQSYLSYFSDAIIAQPDTQHSWECSDPDEHDLESSGSKPLTLRMDERTSSGSESPKARVHMQATAADKAKENDTTETGATWGKKIVQAMIRRGKQKSRSIDQTTNQLTWKLQRTDLLTQSTNFEDKNAHLRCSDCLSIEIGHREVNPYLSFRLYPYGLFKDEGESVTLSIHVTIPNTCPPIDPSAKFLFSWKIISEEQTGKKCTKLHKSGEVSCKFSESFRYVFHFLSHSMLKKVECRDYDVQFTVSTGYCIDH